MIDIFIKTHFSGGHHLRDYPGNCEHPHGHNWKVKVTVRARELDELGMGINIPIRSMPSATDLRMPRTLNRSLAIYPSAL